MATLTSEPNPNPNFRRPAGAPERASFACDPAASRGRRVSEGESRTRSVFQRDRDRIIHSSAFRRLKQKTQVFVAHEGDHYRTRLTHSIEVAQIARSLSRAFGLDEELAEALALGHDLGHPPFGHAGERALAGCMTNFGGFDHNAQTLRIVTALEERYAEFDGLNLTWETVEGLVKHNGPMLGPKGEFPNEEALPWALTAYEGWRELELGTYSSVEAQIAALSDDIAYNNHDLDDGLAADLFELEALEALPLVGETFKQVMDAYSGLDRNRLVHEAIRRLIGAMVEDCLEETRRRLIASGVETVADVRAHGGPMVAFSGEMHAAVQEVRGFLRDNMYRHYRVNRKMKRASKALGELFEAFVNDPSVMPTPWRKRAGGPGDPVTARAACDYIAGMTDGYALDEHKRLFDIRWRE